MSDKKRFWILVALLILSIAWFFIARHWGSDKLLTQLQLNT